MRRSRNLCQRGRGGEARLPKNNRGGPGQSDKKSSDVFCFFFSPQLILQKSNGQNEGVQHFPGGGGPTFTRGVQLLIPYRNPYNLSFSRGGGVRTPCPPLWIRTSLSLPLDVRKSIQSPRHCNSRLVKVSRVKSYYLLRMKYLFNKQKRENKLA